MAIKSIIDVDVKDEAFTRFKTMFGEYQKMLAETPGLWGAANEGIKGSQAAFVAVAAAMTTQTEMIHKLVNGQHDFTTEVEKTSRGWAGMATTTKHVANNILSATTTLLRWASMGGALSGLLGAGGLWGLDKLGANAGNDRRTAQGLGASIGEKRAFDLNFSRYLGNNTDSLLGGINSALTDPREAFKLIGLGAKQEDIASGDAVRVATSILPNLKQLADSTQERYYGVALDQRQIGGFISPEILKLLHRTDSGDLQNSIRQNASDIGSLGLGDKDAKAWQDFTIQLRRAGDQIENVFQKDLVKLSVPLGHLSEVVVGAIDKFMTKLVPEIDDFATWLGSDKIQDDAKAFLDSVADIAAGAANLAGVFGRIGNWLVGKPNEDQASSYKGVPGSAPFLGGFTNPDGTFTDSGENWSGTNNKSGGGAQYLNLIRQLENSKDNAQSPKGARGRYQLMPDTAADLGFTDKDKLFDPAYNTAAATAELRRLAERYKDNVNEVVVAYNGGTRRGDAFRASGDDPSVLPRETQAYLRHAQTIIKIENNTGGNAIVTTAQLPQ